MARADGRIEPGQKLRTAISARAWNRAQQAADIVLGSTPALSAEPGTGMASPYVWVYGKNVSGSAVARWGVLSITGVAITPTSDLTAAATRQFEAMPVLTIDDISGNPQQQRCVAIEPIANNAIGRVAVSGVVQVRLSDADSVTGATRIWSNDEWALMRFGSSTLRLCKTTNVFLKGTVATLNVYEDGTPPSESQTAGETIADVVNKFADIPACAFVSVAQHNNGRWYVVAWEC